MRLGADHVRVRVPATSANLGPGFDAFGIALGLYDELEVRALGSPGVTVEVTGEGAGQVPDDEQHLVVSSLRAALDQVGASQTGLHLVCHNRIPHGRGLGSSAGAVVAGIVAARGLIAEPEALSDDVAIDLAARIEGHPDNAAPAVLGGATLAWRDDGRFRAIDLAVHDDLALLAIVPPNHLSTKAARGVLPATVPHARRRVPGRPRRAAGRGARAGAPSCCSPRRRTGCTRSTGASVMPRLARARRRAAGRRASPPSCPAPGRRCWCSRGADGDGDDRRRRRRRAPRSGAPWGAGRSCRCRWTAPGATVQRVT